MNELVFIGLVIMAIIASVIFLTLKERRRCRQMIQNRWGQDPSLYYQPNEKSLGEASAYLLDMVSKKENVNLATWHDLDLFEVFKKINLTYSKYGEDMLYSSLKSVEVNAEEQLIVDEAWQDYLEQHTDEREDIQYQLHQLGKKTNTNSIYRYFSDEFISDTPLSTPLIKLAACLPILSLMLMIVTPKLGLGIFIASIFFNVVFYLVYKAKLEMELSTLSYYVQTLGVSVKLSKTPLLESSLKPLIQPLKSILKYGFFFRVKSGSEVEVMIESLSAMFLLPFVSFQLVDKTLRKHQKELKELCLLIGKLDANCAVLNFKQMNEGVWCKPQFHHETEINVKELIHPLIKEPVANNFTCHKTVLITGSNASGKSTFIKSLGISCILSQTLNMALAEEFSLRRGVVMSSMGISDDISEGDSYFMSEIKSLKEMIDNVATGSFTYCFIDEILRGTNTIERIGASANTIKWLSQKDCLLFVATHDVELPHILAKHCEMIYFSETVREGQFSFDYKLKIGINTHRNAIKLLDIVGFPEEITNNATKDIAQFEATHHWQEVN